MIKLASIDLFPPASWFKEVTAKSFISDALAGLTGSIVALPQGVAFAIIAGLPPIYGLYSAMIIPIVAALFGSSRHLVSGPTTPISIVIFSTVSQFAEPSTMEFVSVALVVTLGVGIIQLVLGLTGMGAMVNFVNKSVIIGFTAGASLLIITSQTGSLLGISVPRGSSFVDTWEIILGNLDLAQPLIFAIGGSALFLAILIKLINKNIPYLLLAMIIVSGLTYYLFSENQEIKLVGELPQGFPPFSVPEVKFSKFMSLVPNMFAIALLGLIEAVALGRSIALKSGQRINANQEFFGQGLSNIVGSFFSCFTGSGSFTRSGINYSAGAVTPLSSIFSALILMFSLSFIAPLAAYLPVPVMSGVIILVAYNLIDFKNIIKLFQTSGRESTVMTITFLSTLFLQLEYAIYLGVLFSLIFYLRQTSMPRFVQLSPDPQGPRHSFLNVYKFKLETCPQLMVFRIEGSLFFGAIEHVADKMEELLNEKEKNLLIVANNINLIDNAGAEFLVNEVKKWHRNGKEIYFCGFKLRSREFLRNGLYVKEIGEDHFFLNKEHAIEEIYKKLDREICSTCQAQIYRECPNYERKFGSTGQWGG